MLTADIKSTSPCDKARSIVPLSRVLKLSQFINRNRINVLAAAVALVAISGCARGPTFISATKQVPIDRQQVEYPAGMVLTTCISGLTAPSAVAFETDDNPFKGSILIAESGAGDTDPKIFGFKPDGTQFWIYPHGSTLPFIGSSFRIYGPVGGMAIHNGKIYVSHRDVNGNGVITAFQYNGDHNTLVADLPAKGDFGITDLAIYASKGRLYFGVGSATNSGVVGLDNWDVGWVDQVQKFCDQALVPLKLNGYRFTTTNPKGGLFGGDDIAVTAPFQGFGMSRQLRIPESPVGKPTAAVYSVNIEGGDLRVEAHGLHLPRGLVFNEYNRLFVSNDGMELRGTRPVKDDPDALLRVPLEGQVWFGWPDFSADLQPISDQRFQPPQQMIIRSGYPELAFVLDHEASGLVAPDRRLVQGIFPSLSGAAKMTFIGDNVQEPLKEYHGSIIVALSGDRAPFANSGAKLVGPQGYMVSRVQLDSRDQKPIDFVYNTKRLPASLLKEGEGSLERPIDVKIGPDGALYILDYGQMEMKKGSERIKEKTGKLYRLGLPVNPPPSSFPSVPEKSDKPLSIE